mgnify:CR=1 FL=1|jgi:hypothetical protein
MSKRNLPADSIILFISLWCAFEFIISPYPFYGKVNGVFPTIDFGLKFDLSEILIYSFIFLSLLLLLRRFLTKQNITLGYGYNKYLILIFSVFLLSSILVGFFARGPTFLVMVRVQMILLLFLIFMNLYDTKYLMTKIIKILYYTGLINVFIAFCAFFQIELWRLTIYPDFISYMKYMWFGLYVSIFSYAILLNKIFIKRKSSMLDYALLIMIVIVVLINITNKPIFLAAFIVTFTTLLVFFNARIKRVKIGIISLLVLLSPMFLYLGLDEEKKFLFVYVVSERFLKAPAYDLTDLVENLTTMESSGGRDFSAGRLELWQWYLSNVLDTPIVSDNFGARPSIPLSSVGDEEVEFAAHNSVVHYTYYAGYIAGVSLLLIILYFIKTTFNYKKRLVYYNTAKKYKLKEYEFHGMLAFMYAIIGNELVGGPLSNAKFSWFWWLLVVFVLKVISETRMQYKNV